MVCGGGGVGKTTVSASLAIAAAKIRSRVLVVTIDPAKRLLQAFGFQEEALSSSSGVPLLLSNEVKAKLGLAESASLSVAMLNPKYVLEQILAQTLSPVQAETLKRTMLYGELSQMIYGLQEYTAYEWVTRMIQNNDYDLIVLDTPPAFHAKDFFNAPAKIKNLMESRVFQLFVPKKSTWFTRHLSFGWIEKLLGSKVYNESRVFFETFVALRERILERCDLLSQFFVAQEVAVVAVGTPESTAGLELDGLVSFLKAKSIPLETLIINQVEAHSYDFKSDPALSGLDPALLEKLSQLKQVQDGRAEKGSETIEKIKTKYPTFEVRTLPMSYSEDGLEILKGNAAQLTTQ